MMKLLPHILSLIGRPRKPLAALIPVVALLGLWVTPAQASYVTADFASVTPGQVVTITYGSHVETGWAGDYNFTNATGAITGNFTGFCIDVAQNISFGQHNVEFDKTDLALAPIDTPAVPPMGGPAANLISLLWGQHFAESQLNDSTAAAFQIAIWEIINDTSGLPHSVSTGNFTVTASSPTQAATTLYQADLWLSTLDLQGARADDLIALTSTQFQDYVVEGGGTINIASVPAPPGIVLGLLGTISLILPSAWRFRKVGSGSSASV